MSTSTATHHNSALYAEFAEAALNYRDRGFSVLPIRESKKPAVKTWSLYQSRLVKRETLDRWFTPDDNAPARHGVGIILGKVSDNLAVRDFDEEGVYEAWRDAHPELAATLPTVQTARGYHVYFRAKGVSTKRLEGGELRGEGAYVVAPPSIHESGIRYEWIIPLPAGEVPEADPGVFLGDANFDCGEVSSAGLLESLVCLDSLGLPVSLVSDPALYAVVEEAISFSLPAGFGERNNAIFEFARRLKAMPELADRRAVDLIECVKRWHEAARSKIKTKEWDETWADFIYAWPRVKQPYGLVLGEALHRAKDAPDPRCAAIHDTPETRLLLRLCRELQVNNGQTPFFLGAAEAGEAIGVCKDTANRRLQMLDAEQIIIRTRKGHTGRASEFFYIGDGETGITLETVKDYLRSA